MRRRGQTILAITHSLGGGVSQYVAELRNAIEDRAAMLELTPTDSGAVVLRNLDPEDDFRVAFDPESDYQELVDLLRSCGVSRIHVQHLLGHTLDVLRLKQDLGVPLDITVHDYFFVCRRVTLTDDRRAVLRVEAGRLRCVYGCAREVCPLDWMPRTG